jgi:hypothetical protein
MSDGTNWLPGEPEASGSSNYFRLKDLDAAPDKTLDFRILCPFIGGWEAWDDKGRPHRFPTKADVAESGLVLREEPGKKNPKQFWASFVWNPAKGQVQVFSFSQVTLFKQLDALVRNKKWGALDAYDISITRSGSGTDTEYTVMPSGKEPLSPEASTAWAKVQNEAVGLDALYQNGNPLEAFGGQ